jgi:hypothetical protein
MAIVFFEDFEAGTSLRCEAFTTNVSFIASGSGMFGRFLRIAASASTEFVNLARYGFSTSRDEALVSFAFVPRGMPTGANRIFCTLSGVTRQVCLYVNADGRLAVSRDATVLGTTTDPVIIFPNVRYRIELGFSISDTTGTIVLKVNGTEVLNLTSQDTRNGIDGFDKIQFSRARLDDTGQSDFDDILVDDDKTAFRGDFYGQPLVPVSDVSGYSTPSSGSNRWAMVDEMPYSAADYNTYPATGEDIFGINDLSDSPTNIYGVAVNFIAKKDETGTCDMRSKLYSGSANATGANQTINVASQFFQQLVLTDPDTAAAWTPAAVNAMTVGIERTA